MGGKGIPGSARAKKKHGIQARNFKRFVLLRSRAESWER